MTGRRLATAGFAAAFVVVVMPGLARAQTFESAHAFIKDQSIRGTTSFVLDGSYPEFYARVESIDSSGCITKLSGRNQKNEYVSRTFDWSKVSNVTQGTPGGMYINDVVVSGTVLKATGEVTGYGKIQYESPELAARILKAVQLIVSQCDKSRSFGF